MKNKLELLVQMILLELDLYWLPSDKSFKTQLLLLVTMKMLQLLNSKLERKEYKTLLTNYKTPKTNYLPILLKCKLV